MKRLYQLSEFAYLLCLLAFGLLAFRYFLLPESENDPIALYQYLSTNLTVKIILVLLLVSGVIHKASEPLEAGVSFIEEWRKEPIAEIAIFIFIPVVLVIVFVIWPIIEPFWPFR